MFAAWDVEPLAFFGHKKTGFHAARQGPDKRRDVHPNNAPAVLGPDLDRCGIGNHKLPAVTGDVVVNAPFYGPQQRRLAVEPRRLR